MTKYWNTTSKLLAALAVVSIFFIPSSIVNAVTPAPTNNDVGQALEISPPVINVPVDPGKDIEVKISLRNVSSDPIVVTGEINDFTAAGEDGTPKLLLQEGETSPYSLKKWIDPLPKLTLKSKEMKDFPVSIRVPASASPGGYYAVVRFTASAPTLDGTGVSLSASLGSLILLRVNGQATEGLSIESFNTAHMSKQTSLFESAPIDFVLRLKNTGNVHQQPSGQAIVSDMFGNPVGAVNYNFDQKNILPGSVRKFEEPLDSQVIGNRMLFGRYTANLKMTYGSDKREVTSTISFWVIPWKLILVLIAGLIGGFFLIRYGLRRYNEHILSQSSRRRYR